MPQLLFMCPYGADEPERAMVPFIAANVAAASGQETAVVCTVEGVRLGTRGAADAITVEAMPPLAQLMTEFIAAGGEVWLCSACATKRGITEADVIEGARIVGAAHIVATIADGAQAVTLT